MSKALLFLASVFAFAGKIDTRLSTLEKQMMEVASENVFGTYGARFAALPYIDGFGCFVTIDPLFWHAKVGGTEFSYSGLSSSIGEPIKGDLQENGFDWDFGVRVGLGYVFVQNGFDFTLTYTWFDTTDSNATAKNQPSALYYLKSPILFTMGQAAKSTYKIGYNALNAMLGRNYFVSSQLNFYPKLGIQTIWLDQSQKVRYYDIIADPSFGVVEIRNIDHCRFWGIGPSVANESNWYIAHGFSLYCDMAVSLIMGNYKVSQNHSMTSSGDPDAVSNNKIQLTGDTKAMSPLFSLGIGILWDYYFEENCARVLVGLGYEADYLWTQNQMLQAKGQRGDSSVSLSSISYKAQAEDVSFYGLILKTRFDF